MLVVILAFALHFTIQDDINRGKPQDDLPRAEAAIINFPDSYSIEENGSDMEMYSNVQIEVSLGDNEKQITYISGTVPKNSSGELKYGSTIKVKYSPDDHSVFYYANDPVPHYRVFLYVVYSILIVACIGATIFSSKVTEHLAQKRIVEENMRRVRDEHDAGAAEASAGYRGIDGKDNVSAAVDPFANDKTDYNAIFEQNRRLDDAEYSAEGTYSAYDSSHSDADTAYTYQGESGSFSDHTYGVCSPGAPSGSPYDNDAQAIQPDNSYGMPNASMDASYDTDTPYSGYGMPNASMDAPYDTDTPYSGYGMPNVSMDAPYDTDTPYSGYGMPNASMDAPYDPNIPYTGT